MNLGVDPGGERPDLEGLVPKFFAALSSRVDREGSERTDGPKSRATRRNINRSVGHCHSERSETVDQRRKESRRRENDMAFRPESTAALRNAFTPEEPHPLDILGSLI